MSESRPIYLEQDPPREKRFLAFTGDDWSNACAVFVKKYGVEPEAVLNSRRLRLVFVGPVPDQVTVTNE